MRNGAHHLPHQNAGRDRLSMDPVQSRSPAQAILTIRDDGFLNHQTACQPRLRGVVGWDPFGYFHWRQGLSRHRYRGATAVSVILMKLSALAAKGNNAPA